MSSKFYAPTWLWYNLKGYLANYGDCLLDLLLCDKNNPEADLTLEKYDNFEGQFANHFNLMEFSQPQFGDYKYPFVGVKIIPRRSERCEVLLTLSFYIYYHQPSPKCENGCNRCMFTTPENTLKWKDDVTRAIGMMMRSQELNDNDILQTVNFADKMRCNEEVIIPGTTSTGIWPYNMAFNVVEEPTITEPRIELGGIMVFNIEYDIAIHWAAGKGHCTKNTSDCPINCGTI